MLIAATFIARGKGTWVVLCQAVSGVAKGSELQVVGESKNEFLV